MTDLTEKYTLNRDAAYSIARSLATMSPIESMQATETRAILDYIRRDGLEIAAQLPKHVAAEIDDTCHAAHFPEWAKAKAAGARFTQPKLLRDARRSRPSRMVG